jgi:hypothetical protein
MPITYYQCYPTNQHNDFEELCHYFLGNNNNIKRSKNMSKLDEITQMLQFNTTSIENSCKVLNKNIQDFESKLATFSDFVNYAGRRENTTVHLKLLAQFKNKWESAKAAEHQRIIEICSCLVENINANIALVAQSIYVDFCERFEYIF